MSIIQAQGVHHITFVGSNRDATIDFYEGVLGMPLVMEQPNLDVPEETHLYFDAGDGRLITFFVRPIFTCMVLREPTWITLWKPSPSSNARM